MIALERVWLAFFHDSNVSRCPDIQFGMFRMNWKWHLCIYCFYNFEQVPSLFMSWAMYQVACSSQMAEHFHLPLCSRERYMSQKGSTPNTASSYVTPDGKWDFSSTGDYYCYTAAASPPVPGGGGSCQNQTTSVIVPSIKCHFSVTAGKF